MRRLPPTPVPAQWDDAPLWSVLTPRKETGQPDLPLLSVYRDHGVIPKSSRDDNFNKPGIDLSTYQVVRPGDVVANKMKTWQGSIAVSDHRGIVSPAYLVLATDGSIYPRYLHYLLRSRPYVAEYGRLSYGLRPAQWDLRWDDLRDVRLLRPPKHSQVAIAEFLDRETDRIDLLIDNKGRLIDLLQEKQSALITQAVTRGLDSTALMRDGGKWLGEIPSHWDQGPLRRWWRVLDCKHLTAEYIDGGVPVVGTVQVKGVRLDLAGSKTTTTKDFVRAIEGEREPRRGDIIYSRNASLGAASYVDTDDDFCMGQDVCLIRSEGEDQLYLTYLLRSPVVTQQVETEKVGATFFRINVEQIRNYTVVRPPPIEQSQIAFHLDRLCDSTAALVTRLAVQVSLLAENRQALITAAVTGELDIACFDGERAAEEATG